MKRRLMLLPAIAAMAIGPALAQASDKTAIEGRVVDGAGRPVAGCQVATFWSWEEGRPSASRPLDVGPGGTFRGELDFRGRAQTLIAYADDASLAGAASVTEEQAGDVVITLRPSVHVKLRLTCSDLGGDAGWVNSYWTYQKGRAVMATAEDGLIDLKLPAGEWQYWTYGRQVNSRQGEVELDGATGEHDMGVLDLPGTFIALNRGRTVDDWHVTDARGVPIEKAQVRHYKGKWLLVEFWGYW